LRQVKNSVGTQTLTTCNQWYFCFLTPAIYCSVNTSKMHLLSFVRKYSFGGKIPLMMLGINTGLTSRSSIASVSRRTYRLQFLQREAVRTNEVYNTAITSVCLLYVGYILCWKAKWNRQTLFTAYSTSIFLLFSYTKKPAKMGHPHGGLWRH